MSSRNLDFCMAGRDRQRERERQRERNWERERETESNARVMSCKCFPLSDGVRLCVLLIAFGIRSSCTRQTIPEMGAQPNEIVYHRAAWGNYVCVCISLSLSLSFFTIAFPWVFIGSYSCLSLSVSLFLSLSPYTHTHTRIRFNVSTCLPLFSSRTIWHIGCTKGSTKIVNPLLLQRMANCLILERLQPNTYVWHMP